MRECETCSLLLEDWVKATSNHSVIVGRLVDAEEDRNSRLYDEASEALEMAAGARAFYEFTA